MKLLPRDQRRLMVLLYHFSHGKKSARLSSLRLAHLLSVPEVRVLELLAQIAEEDHIVMSGMSEEVIQKRDTPQEIKEQATPYEERCRIKHADVGVKWGFSPIDYVIYDLAAIYRRERERRTTCVYMVFSPKRDPRKQPAWGIFRRTHEQIKENGWDVDKYMIAQIEGTAWCKAFIFIPSTWLGTEKAKERMCQWLENNKKATIFTKKDSAYEQSRHFINSIVRSRKLKSEAEALSVPGVIEQLDITYLQEILKSDPSNAV